MNEQSKAVFVSYASQDAEAARRVCDALRAAGLEVWFDRSELRGGDAWDASIRRQIKECALFVPIISANTQSRTEGYFRLEWRLAEQRSHLMAKGRPFIVPVAIDGTPDAGAHVPDSFLEVQWSRLPDGQSDATFAARMRQLISGEMSRPAGAGTGSKSPADASRPRRTPWLTIGIVSAAMLVALAPSVVTLVRGPATKSPPVASQPPAGSAAERVARARELLDDDPLITRRNVELAEQFALEAVAKDPSNAEAFAAAAWANFRFIQANYENSPKRRADLRSHAEKAKLLDPGSINAELALSGLLMVNRNWAEADQRLQKLVERAPANLAVLREATWAAARISPDATTAPESQAIGLDRMRAVSPLGRSYADTQVAATHWRKGEYVEADRLLDGTFASGHPIRATYLIRLLVLLYGWGDLAAARQFAATIPSKLLLEDVFIAHVAILELFSGEHGKALETLGRSQRDLLQEALIDVPTALLRGDVHDAAGRPAAAALQWREALKTIDRQLGTRPDSALLHGQKAILLAMLGERKEAAAVHALARELGKNPAAGSIEWGKDYEYHAAAGDKEGAIVRLDRLVQRDYGRWPGAYNHLRYNPSLRALQGDPRVKAMRERGARWLTEMKASRKP